MDNRYGYLYNIGNGYICSIPEDETYHCIERKTRLSKDGTIRSIVVVVNY